MLHELNTGQRTDTAYKSIKMFFSERLKIKNISQSMRIKYYLDEEKYERNSPPKPFLIFMRRNGEVCLSLIQWH